MGLEETKQEIINSKARVINVWAGPGSGKSYLVAQMIRSLFEKETYESKRNKLSECTAKAQKVMLVYEAN